MKKLIFILLVLPFLNSCSSDSPNSSPVAPSDSPNSNPVAPEGTRLKKVVITDINNGYSSPFSISEYFYNGDKLYKTVASGGAPIFYFYTGDLITKKLIGSGPDAVSTSFTYNANGKLASEIVNVPYNGSDYIYYTYNSDGSIFMDYYSDFNSTHVPQHVKIRKVFFQNNNVVRAEDYNDNSTTHNQILYYAYDSKEAPTNGILGYSKLLDYKDENGMSVNNLVTSGTGLTGPNVQVRYAYVYYSNGYPKTGAQTSPLTPHLTRTSEYIYE